MYFKGEPQEAVPLSFGPGHGFLGRAVVVEEEGCASFMFFLLETGCIDPAVSACAAAQSLMALRADVGQGNCGIFGIGIASAAAGRAAAEFVAAPEEHAALTEDRMHAGAAQGTGYGLILSVFHVFLLHQALTPA